MAIINGYKTLDPKRESDRHTFSSMRPVTPSQTSSKLSKLEKLLSGRKKKTVKHTSVPDEDSRGGIGTGVGTGI